MVQRKGFDNFSASALVEQADTSNEMEPGIISRGLKIRYPENTAEEWATVQAYHGNYFTEFLAIKFGFE